MVDIKIVGGQVVDGTGSPGFYATVLVEGDTISIHRGDHDQIDARRTIDATDHVVSPGFIDVHSHAGLTILGEPHHDPKIRQGVTTELIGIDGNSWTPFHTHDELRQFIELDSGLNGYPPEPADWLTLTEFLVKFHERVAVNICYILGNSPVRIWGVGWEDRPATRDEMANMRAAVRETMEEGAWGLSTGLDYPPGSYASTDELIELCAEAARLGGFYHTHTRASLRSKGLLAPWEEALDIGRGSGIPVHLTHYRQGAQGDGSHLDYLGLVEDARDEGMDVTFDCYTYPYSGTRVTIALPQWTMDGGVARLKRALTDGADRERIISEMSDGGSSWRNLSENWLTNFKQPQNARYDGHSVTEIAAMRGQEPVEALLDLLIEENLGISTVALGTNAHTLSEFVSHPYGMIGSDALLFGDHPSPRTYGCFPLVLAEFVRAEKNLRLPEAIRKMTSFPAQRLGIPDRGILRDGFRADIVIFHAENVKTRATKANPKVYPEGIPYVIVNGKIVIDEGENTGALAGRSLKRGRART
ncbi:MAG: amidohydrolase family protein [Chloroflexi bacterium]|nr:amidohydrolase family protein [Chloroflexota bacterium]